MDKIYNEGGTKYVDTEDGKVINTTIYPCKKPSELSATLKINANEYGAFAEKIDLFIHDYNK